MSIIIVAYFEITRPPRFRSCNFRRAISDVWRTVSLATLVTRATCFSLSESSLLWFHCSRTSTVHDSTMHCTIDCLVTGKRFSLNVKEECTSRWCRADGIASVAWPRVMARSAYLPWPVCSSSVPEIPVDRKIQLL